MMYKIRKRTTYETFQNSPMSIPGSVRIILDSLRRRLDKSEVEDTKFCAELRYRVDSCFFTFAVTTQEVAPSFVALRRCGTVGGS